MASYAASVERAHRELRARFADRLQQCRHCRVGRIVRKVGGLDQFVPCEEGPCHDG